MWMFILALLNIVENFLNIAYLYLAYVVQWPSANLVAFTSANLTLAKTLLYWLQEYYCGWCNIGHNNTQDLIQYWIIPNGYAPRFFFYLFYSSAD